MKITHFFSKNVNLFLIVLFLTIGFGCSDSKQSASEQNSTPVEENTTVRETETIEEEPEVEEVEPEKDVQASVTPQKIQKPENKQPVLTAMSTSYKEWNADGNNVLDKDEFYQGLYNVWDEDQDGEISDAEFTNGANNFFADYNFKEYGQYADWDTDSNNKLSAAEFREGMKGTVDRDPTAHDLLVIWDTDNDDAIERIELDNITVRLDEDSN